MKHVIYIYRKGYIVFNIETYLLKQDILSVLNVIAPTKQVENKEKLNIGSKIVKKLVTASNKTGKKFVLSGEKK